ncbi:MAG: Hsp20/alpha crystallin family protein [Victivallales bacterium]|nr:Hsp20/alpha crystallin family protein [Victivallales bacterium]
MKKNKQIEKWEKGNVSSEMTHEEPIYAPATNIYETETELIVSSEMPGVNEKNVDVSLEDRTLTITGSRGDNEIPKGYQLLSHGYSPGSYTRSFKILADVDVAKIKARISDGVLRLTLPKAGKTKPKNIKVSA